MKKKKDLLDNLTVAAMVPLAIAGSIAVMIMSYLLVPLIIVTSVFFVLKTLHAIDNQSEDE